MRYHVNKKRFFRTVGNLVILDIILVSLVVFSFMVLQLEDLNPFMLIVIIPFFVLCNLASIPLLVMQGSIVVFEEDVVKCLFRKRTRREIKYDEIKDYGVFWIGKIKFIYVSRMVLTEIQRNAEAFRLYSKTKDVIVLEYQIEVMDFLERKCS